MLDLGRRRGRNLFRGSSALNPEYRGAEPSFIYLTGGIMDQGTQEWLTWRQSGIGASDMPVLFGLSDKTPFMLWQEKMGLTTSEISTYARGKGGDTEARLRAKYSLETGRQYGPVLAAHDKYPWMLASLDMYTVEDKHQYMGEVKFVGAKVYESILDAGTIPKKHMVQMQQQMLVIGECEAVYLVSCDGDNYKAISVEPDAELQTEIISRGLIFYSYMVNKTPPPLEANDWWPGGAEIISAVANGDRALVKSLMPNKRVTVPGARLSLDINGVLKIKFDKV